jgi:hypothetical protein
MLEAEAQIPRVGDSFDLQGLKATGLHLSMPQITLVASSGPPSIAAALFGSLLMPAPGR